MTTRTELLEALTHVLDTRARLAREPGTHRQRAELQPRIDELLDALNHHNKAADIQTPQLTHPPTHATPTC